MKLYFSPGASSFALHVLLRETGLPFVLEPVDLAQHKLLDGRDYYEINARGLVPVLELDDGTRLTEQGVIAQYLCDLAGRTDLMPAAGSVDRLRVIEWVSYVGTELHKSFSPLFWPIDEDMRVLVKNRLRRTLALISRGLEAAPYLTGETFTAADSYLFNVASWAARFDLGTEELPGLEAFLRRIAARPSVQAALKAEGPGLVTIPAGSETLPA